ncbi:HNH endonuclease [bacterium]|nr:HNH endonuclease [bacterium]
MLTQELVRSLFDYDPEVGSLIHKIDKGTNKVKGLVAGYNNEYKKASMVYIFGKNHNAHKIVWLWYYGYIPENLIDHIDRNPFNNKISNLREVTNQCNIRNTGNFKNNVSGVKGVRRMSNTRAKKWIAAISVSGRKYHLGLYENFDDAICARLAAEQCFNWANCDSSSPAFKYVQRMLN